MKKTFIVLDMYEDLLAGSKLNSKTCNDKYGISESTFYRYLGDLREYLWEQHLREIVYFPQENTYKIIK
ncbi:MAG: helix-turn-helix domain-containing protein [Clostridia bacterium]|nr:helix-turn-helix domain-containing protein [Clostridia bacterium]